jgi:hypothetical protein
VKNKSIIMNDPNININSFFLNIIQKLIVYDLSLEDHKSESESD